MIYERKIKQAYGGLPVLGEADLRYGDVVGLTPGDVGFWPPEQFVLRAAAREIVRYNRSLYPWSRRIYVNHSIVMRGGLKYFEVTVPEGRFGDLGEEGLRPDRVYVVCRYRFHRIEDAVERIPFEVVFDTLDGAGYDYGQLIAILVNYAFGLDPEYYLPFLDFARGRVVCSVAAIMVWLIWWIDQGRREGHPRPMIDKLHPDKVPPGFFDNDPMWDVVGIIDGGYLT